MSKDKTLSKEELYKQFESAGFRVSYREKEETTAPEVPTTSENPTAESTEKNTQTDETTVENNPVAELKLTVTRCPFHGINMPKAMLTSSGVKYRGWYCKICGHYYSTEVKEKGLKNDNDGRMILRCDAVKKNDSSNEARHDTQAQTIAEKQSTPKANPSTELTKQNAINKNSPNTKDKTPDIKNREQRVWVHNQPVSGFLNAGVDGMGSAIIPCCNELELPSHTYVRVTGFTNAKRTVFYTSKEEYWQKVVPQIIRDLNLSYTKRYSLREYENKRIKNARFGIEKGVKKKVVKKKTVDEPIVNVTIIKKAGADETSGDNPIYDQLPLIPASGLCLICGAVLQDNQTFRVVTWRDERKTGSRMISASFCCGCELPFIDEMTFRKERSRLSPSYFRVFNAKSGMSRDAVATKIGAAVRKKATQPQKQVIAEKQPELPAKQTAAPRAGNLSQLPPNQVIEIYAKKCTCTKCGQLYSDNMESCTAVVDTVSGKQAKVTVMHCVVCGKYYMNYESFKQYNKMYGGLLCEIKLEPTLWAEAKTWSGFAPDSVLSRCGYTVKEGTTVEYRQRVLAYVISSGRATKAEVVQLITGFMKTHKTIHPAACERWKEDIKYVNNYRGEAQREVHGLSFKQKGKLTR